MWTAPLDAPIDADAIRAARNALSRPIGEAQGLPGRFYGEEFYALEKHRLFPRSWCAVAVGASIPAPGDVLPIDLGGMPILLVRGPDHEVQAFHNICRHRAMRLVAEPCNVPRLRCPWHSWTYDLEGKLLAMPEISGAKNNVADGFDKADLGLVPVAVGRWLDYIFINVDGQAAPFEAYIKPLADLLAGLKLDCLRHASKLVDVYEGNWKLATEGGIEDYHLPFGHPQLNAHLYRNTTPYSAEQTFAGGGVAVPQDETDDRPWNARLPGLTMRDGGPLRELFVFNVFPTGTVLIAADHVMLGMLLPDGAARTTVELHLYFDGDAATSEPMAPARQETLDMWHGVLPQDFPFIEGTQATIQSRDAAGIRTRFSPYWEQAVLKFQQMVLDAVV